MEILRTDICYFPKCIPPPAWNASHHLKSSFAIHLLQYDFLGMNFVLCRYTYYVRRSLPIYGYLCSLLRPQLLPKYLLCAHTRKLKIHQGEVEWDVQMEAKQLLQLPLKRYLFARDFTIQKLETVFKVESGWIYKL